MSAEKINKEIKPTALVLAGGGARGAYEAGVLHYILNDLPTKNDVGPRFNLFTGTSIGALNCCFLASAANEPRRISTKLVDYWRSLSLERILRFETPELSSMAGKLWGKKTEAIVRPKMDSTDWAPHPPIQGIFNTAPLFKEMANNIRWSGIHENINDGCLRGLALCTTEVCTSKSIVFYQKEPTCEYVMSTDPSKESKEVKIHVNHAMASAAIPFLFPSIQINGRCYVDGALRQNTPIYPAIRMGAEKLLVISLAEDPKEASQKARLGCLSNPNPGLMFLLGRMVNAMLTEALDYDLDRLRMFNNLIESGQKIYGDDFLKNINEMTRSYRKAAYRNIDTLLIRPSRGLHDLAIEALQEAPEELNLPGLPGKMLKRFLNSSGFIESQFLSYLMFTPTFIEKLVALGHEDAKKQKKQILEFFAE
jgi:NTE family protein